MYFQAKNTLKNNYKHNPKHAKSQQENISIVYFYGGILKSFLKSRSILNLYFLIQLIYLIKKAYMWD